MAEQEEIWPDSFSEAKSVDDFDFIMSGKNGGPITKILKSKLTEIVGVVGESIEAIQGGATSAAAVALPAGPTGQNRWFNASWGYWKYNNVVLKNPLGTDGIPEGNEGTLYWNGSATTPVWKISKIQALLKGKDAIVVDGFGSTASDEAGSAKNDKVLYSYIQGGENLAFTTTNAYIPKTSTVGQVVTPVGMANWILSSFLDINTGDTINRKGSVVASSSSAAEIYAFDIDNKYLGYYNGGSEDYNVKLSDIFPTVRKFRSNSAAAYAGTFSLTLKRQIKPTAVEGLDKINDINLIVQAEDYFLSSEYGYINDSGLNVGGTTSWIRTQFIKVVDGQDIYVTSNTSLSAQPLWAYDNNFKPIISLLAQGVYANRKVTIPSGLGIAYVKGSARTGATYEHVLKVTSFDQGVINANDIAIGFRNDFFIPSKVYAKENEAISFNINGIVNKHPKDYSRDTFFNIGYGNEDFVKITPTADFTIPIRQRLANNNSVILGDLKVKVKLTWTSPAIPQYFIHFGDSTVEGTANSGIQGAIANELSRRLTGIGTAINPSNSPNPLALSNLYFIGLKGNQPIKHEGIGGKSFRWYLTNTSSENSFINPSTLLFDIGHYLTQNGFVGVTSTGTNLTILCQLGWNDVFNYTLAEIEADCKTWLNLVKASKSGIRVKLISMQLPPIDVFKTYTGTREQSYISTMQKVMSIARLYEKISLESAYSDWVEHISYMPSFFPENAYPTTTVKVNSRDSALKTVNTDDVHPLAMGYAQMADTLFYNILYNYC